MHSFFHTELFFINAVGSLMLHQSAKTFFVTADAAVDLVGLIVFQFVHPVRISQ